MHAIRLRRILESDHPHLPELQSFIGKTIEMIVWENAAPAVTPGTGDWSAIATAARELDGYDVDAWRDQRDIDLQDAIRQFQ